MKKIEGRWNIVAFEDDEEFDDWVGDFHDAVDSVSRVRHDHRTYKDGEVLVLNVRRALLIDKLQKD